MLGSHIIGRRRAALVSGGVFAAVVLAVSIGTARAEDGCNGGIANPKRLSVARTVEIDTATGPVIGNFTKLPHEPNFLAPKEVVLTFDDGPVPWITRSILATLAQHCTRATFFSVGQMALAYPDAVREELAQGHTVGTHTWSHPLTLRRLKTAAAEDEMEKGFAAVTAAAGRPIAALFRFPGLSDSSGMVAHLAARHVATLTVDVVSNDSYIHDAARLTRETLAKVEANQGGIILFHDIKASTAKALPGILNTLAERGYRVVHLVSKQPLEAHPGLLTNYAAQVARALDKTTVAKKSLPFYGAVKPERVGQPAGASGDPGGGETTSPASKRTANRQHPPTGWSTRVRPNEPN